MVVLEGSVLWQTLAHELHVLLPFDYHIRTVVDSVVPESEVIMTISTFVLCTLILVVGLVRISVLHKLAIHASESMEG